MKLGPLLLIAVTCGAANACANEARSTVSLRMGYSSSYEFSNDWNLPSEGSSEFVYEHPLSKHVVLMPSLGYARYSGSLGNNIGDSWNVAVDVVPVGLGLAARTDPSRPLVWRARESLLLIGYRWNSEHFGMFSGDVFPQFEHREELLLGLKIGGGVDHSIGSHGVIGAGIDYLLSEDMDEGPSFGLSGFAHKGLRQFQPYLSLGWRW